VTKAILFDLDGTLADTAPDLAAAVNRIRADQDMEPLPIERLRPFASAGARGLVFAGLGVKPGDAEYDGLRETFLEYYAERICVHTKLFPGVQALLAELKRRGLAWGIVTNKPGWLTDPLLIELGLNARARAVVSGDTLPVRKPSPEPLLHAAAAMGVAPGECVYVGDAERDMQAAQAAGMYALVAGFGYLGDDDRADSWFSHGWLDAPLDLLGWLDTRPDQVRRHNGNGNGAA
jgi:phosphoglycolate phosphatase